MGTLFISITIAVIAATIAFILLFPVINMFFSRVIFGKYSAKYVSTVKKYTGKSPYPYCIKDDFINHITGFYKPPKNFQSFKTDVGIVFTNVEFGIKFKKFLKKNPTPFCINSMRFPQFDLKVLGFRDTMFSTEMKKYFFFINGRFMFGQLTFKNPTSESINEIAAIIAKKYLNSVSLPPSEYFIADKNQRELLCENTGFHLSISYLDRSDDALISLLNDFWDKSTKIRIREISSLEAELMNKL